MVYKRLYESLQHTLCHSSWPPMLAQYPALISRTLFSRTGPFPGLWTCKTGVILWKQTTEGPMLRAFSLHHARHAPIQKLTKCYWHLTFGSHNFAGNHHSLLLNALRIHEKLLRLYNPGTSLIDDGRHSTTHSNPLEDPVFGGNREQVSLSSTVRFPGVRFIRMLIEHTVGSLRTWNCFEPPLAEGKTRVRWRCVSSALSLVVIGFILMATCRSVVVSSMMISTSKGPAQQRRSRKCLTKAPSSVLSSVTTRSV